MAGAQTRTRWRLALAVAWSLSLAATGCRDGGHHGLGEACDPAQPCRPLLACTAGRCVLPPPGPDAGSDAVDAPGAEAAVEVPRAAPDAGIADAATDQAPAADPDAGSLCYGPREPHETFVGYEIPFCLTAVPWPMRTIPVCWTAETARRADFATVSARVESLVRESFMRPTGLEFRGFTVCDPDRLAPLGGVVPAAGRLALSLNDGASWSAQLGFGAGGERRLTLGVGAPALEAAVIEAVVKTLGLTYVAGGRDPSPGRLLPNEAGGLQVFFGRRSGGNIVGAGGRCLEAPAASGEIQTTDCRLTPAQDWQWGQTGTLGVVARADQLLEATPAAAGPRLVPVLPGGPPQSQVWAIRRAALRTDADKCLGVPGGLFAEGRTVTLVTCDGSPSQQWELDFAAGKIRHEGFCLGVPGGVATPMVRLQVQQCATPPAPPDPQSFTFHSNNQIRFRELCVNVFFDTNADGADVGLYECSTRLLNGNELFYFQGQLESGGRCLEGPAGPGPGPVALRECQPGPSQRWDIHLRPIVGR